MGASTTYQENISVSQGGHTAVHRYHGDFDWNSCTPPDEITWVDVMFRDGASGPPGGSDIGFERVFGCSGSRINKISDVTLAADTSWGFRARASLQPSWDTGSPPSPFIVNGTWIFFKTYAVTPTGTTPTASAVTKNSATVQCDFFPNTVASLASVKMQYRLAGIPGGWVDAPGGTSDYSGYTQQTISRDITGLAANTGYRVRMVMTRSTVNETELTVGGGAFTTLADAPTVTTNAASSVGAASAILNGTYDLNDFSSRVRFGWGTSDAGSGTWANYTAYQNVGPSDGDTVFSDSITGLSQSTVYFFRALVEYPSPGFGSVAQGTTATFTTPSNPLVDAALEDHVLTFDYDAVYGVAKTFFFGAASPSATSSNKLLSAAVPWANTECLLLKYNSKANPVSASAWALSTLVNADGRATNAPVRVGSTAFYTLALVAGELDADEVVVWITDTGDAARDVLIRIRTMMQLGQIKTDITQLGGNNPGFTVTGVGTSAGLQAVGGSTSRCDIEGVVGGHVLRRGTSTGSAASSITLDASASSTTDYYVGCIVSIISSTGIEQSRVITAYNGTTKVATVHRSWSTNPASSPVFVITAGPEAFSTVPSAELASIPGTAAAYGLMLQFLFQRFAFKRTQDANTQTMYKADNSTSLGTATVSDNGTLQTSGKLA